MRPRTLRKEEADTPGLCGVCLWGAGTVAPLPAAPNRRRQERQLEKYSGGALSPSPSHALQNRGRKLQNASSRIFLGFHADCNPVSLWKRIGDHFKVLTIEPDTALGPIAKILHVCADLGN
jgi:hypothetical protein